MALRRRSAGQGGARPPPARRPGPAASARRGGADPRPRLVAGGLAWGVRPALLDWFARHARALPWRHPVERSDPYRVLVAEVMLQQTQVVTVVPYYRRWLQRFPDLQALAGADEEAVLRAWQGLGYYRRARNLRRAADQVVRRFGGELPRTRGELERLPGVGRYTAAAVAALAFGRPGVAVDANVRRLAARLHGWPSAPADAEVERALLARFGAPEAHEVAAFAEALIELGALLCSPVAPACGRCPLAAGCVAAREGTPERYPRPKPRRPPPERRRYALAAVASGRLWLLRRDGDGLLGGLWGFPQVADPPAGGRCLDAVRHAYSHFRLVLVPVLVPPEHPALRGVPGARAQPLARLHELPLSAVDLRVLARLAEHGVVPGPVAPGPRQPALGAAEDAGSAPP